MSETLMAKFLADMNSQKLNKVSEAAQLVKSSKYDQPEKKE